MPSTSIVYTSNNLIIEELTPHIFKHTSYLKTKSFGKVGCNGMIYMIDSTAYIFDTPTDDASSVELINWIENTRGFHISGVVVTHFHDDCLGGLNTFSQRGITSYALNKTIELAKQKELPIPDQGFDSTLVLNIHQHQIINLFVGEGHTKDNIVCYIPDEQAMFGGCLIKCMNAGKGNLYDANVDAWPNSVATLKKDFPDLDIVIPGHGNHGGTELFDYTIQLFLP